MMNAWLQGQAKKVQVTEAQMQRKRLGIKEGVNYGDINFRVPVEWDMNTGREGPIRPLYDLKAPRSPESAATLTRRLESLYAVAGDKSRSGIDRARAAGSLAAKGVSVDNSLDINKIMDAAESGDPVQAGTLHHSDRRAANERQIADSKSAKERRVAARQKAANTIGGKRLPGALGVAGALLPLAFGASPAEAAEAAVQGLNPLSIFGDTPAGLGSDKLDHGDHGGEPIFLPPKPKPRKRLPGDEFIFPAKMNENNMMLAWLQGQAQKQELTTTRMQQKRLGINLNESGKQDPEKIVGGLPANPPQAGGSNVRPANPKTVQFTDADMKEMLRQAGVSDIPVKPPVKGSWQEYVRMMAARGTGIGTMGPGGQHGSPLEGLQEQLNPVDSLLEYVMKGTLTHDEHGNPLSAERAERRALRLGQILQIATNSVMRDREDMSKAHDRDESLTFTHNDQLERAIASLKAKGVIGVHDRGDIFDVNTREYEKVMSDDHSPYEARVRAQGKFPEYPSPEWQTLEAHRGAHALQFASPQTPQDADEKQKSLSSKRRTDATNRTAELEKEKLYRNAIAERNRIEEEKRERDKAYWWRITHGYGGGYGGSGSGGGVGMRTGM